MTRTALPRTQCVSRFKAAIELTVQESIFLLLVDGPKKSKGSLAGKIIHAFFTLTS